MLKLDDVMTENAKGFKFMEEYKGEPIEIIDRFGDKRFVDFEHIANNKTKFAYLVYKYRSKWYFYKIKGVGRLLINKENIKQVLI